MNINNLKVGDKVFIREDLKPGGYYGAGLYKSTMVQGWCKVRGIFNKSGTFSVKTDNGNDWEFLYHYTPEMVDWEKTRGLNNIKNSNRMENINTTDLAKEYLNSKFGYLNINKDVANKNIFKEITQSGESGNEITKAITQNGEEIIAKNNGEENDVEKAVMLLMLKARGFTYSEIKKEVEKVKVKWIPKLYEEFYTILGSCVVMKTYYSKNREDTERLSIGNCFKTREEAERKAEEIKELLKGE